MYFSLFFFQFARHNFLFRKKDKRGSPVRPPLKQDLETIKKKFNRSTDLYIYQILNLEPAQSQGAYKPIPDLSNLFFLSSSFLGLFCSCTPFSADLKVATFSY